MGYSKMAITNNYLSAFIRNLGYETIDCTTNDVALTVPMAMQAGLGDLARNGLLIAPKFGPRIRLSKVITDLPLVPDSPIDFGVIEFCSKCEICAEQCPSQSIMRGERTAEAPTISNLKGTIKWPIDPETCRMYWARLNRPCTTCIACCPYNKPDTPFHRTVNWFTDHVRWADPLYVWLDKLCGYGKPVKPDSFWDDWRPDR
jgi:reductive dehalogenase